MEQLFGGVTATGEHQFTLATGDSLLDDMGNFASTSQTHYPTASPFSPSSIPETPTNDPVCVEYEDNLNEPISSMRPKHHCPPKSRRKSGLRTLWRRLMECLIGLQPLLPAGQARMYHPHPQSKNVLRPSNRCLRLTLIDHLDQHWARRVVHDSSLSGAEYMTAILHGHPCPCLDLFRMEQAVFKALVKEFRDEGWLKDTNNVFVEEQVGWEGTAHDSRILSEIIQDPAKMGRATPQNKEEVFNQLHSSLRNVIKRTFGVWKKKKLHDSLFEQFHSTAVDEDHSTEQLYPVIRPENDQQEMNRVRDEIANLLVSRR
ncbi:hypothetical protein QJS04_geneDACA020454 [Acorus gramineus]|uniref:DUF8040 domain-containing protein n=1 Tax=Acorus gramineus TaxID=55184 RepID=A0AAV9AES0_ACOGR|nr:hypothetical protein QJS04_geneDACA020454 [Acorus gramineus]